MTVILNSYEFWNCINSIIPRCHLNGILILFITTLTFTNASVSVKKVRIFTFNTFISQITNTIINWIKTTYGINIFWSYTYISRYCGIRIRITGLTIRIFKIISINEGLRAIFFNITHIDAFWIDKFKKRIFTILTNSIGRTGVNSTIFQSLHHTLTHCTVVNFPISTLRVIKGTFLLNLKF